MITVKVCRVDKPKLCREINDVVVDTGAVVSAIPAATARELGIKFPNRRQFTLANGKKITKSVGTAILEVEGRESSDDIIAITSGHPLLSVRALEGMGFQVDPTTRKLKKLDSALLL
jgi:predicted aspartyl protease